MAKLSHILPQSKYKHTKIGGLLYTALTLYVRKNALGFVGYEKIMISLSRNDYEPDICFFNKEKSIEFSEDITFSARNTN